MDSTPFSDKLAGAFGYKPQNLPPPVPAPLPKKTYNTRDSVVRDNPLDTTVVVQNLVWGNSSPGPGQQTDSPGPGAPAGLGQTMSKGQGWGQTVG